MVRASLFNAASHATANDTSRQPLHSDPHRTVTNRCVSRQASDSDAIATKIEPKESTMRCGAADTVSANLRIDVVSPDNAAADASTLAGESLGKFVLERDEVVALMQQLQCNEEQLLQHLIKPASSLARPPISCFPVGAVGLGASGRIFFGVNLEFERLPLYCSVHAEQFLVVNALHHGERALRLIAVSAAPCGHCRQFCTELDCADTVRFIFGDDKTKRFTLDDMLPLKFGPKDLLDNGSQPLLLLPQNHNVAWTSAAHDIIAERESDATFQTAAQLAFQEAQQAYAPYSKCPAGVAVVTANGNVYSGGYIESAAYNPSLPPLQTAIVDAVVDGMSCYTVLHEVVLAELDCAAVQHRAAVAIMLNHIAPAAKLTVLPIDWASS